MVGLVVVCCVLALAVPASVFVGMLFAHKIVESSLRHMKDTQVVGGQPVDIVRNQTSFTLEQRKEHNAYQRATKKPLTIEQVVS